MSQPPVSDAGPIISFARADRLEILYRVLPQLILPEVVLEELTVKGIGRPGADAVDQGRGKWILVKPLTNQARLAQVSPLLDPGERQAIALALELGAELLIDERAGRAEARRLLVPLLSTLAVLRVAHKPLGLIPQVKPVLDHLIRAGGFRLSKALYTQYIQDGPWRSHVTGDSRGTTRSKSSSQKRAFVSASWRSPRRSRTIRLRRFSKVPLERDTSLPS